MKVEAIHCPYFHIKKILNQFYLIHFQRFTRLPV